MARPKNARVLAVRLLRDAKSAVANAISLLESETERNVYVQPSDQDHPENYVRARRPEEHGDNDVRKFLAVRRNLSNSFTEIRSADILVRYRLAELGCDPIGHHVGVAEAMARLSDNERAWAEIELGRTEVSPS
jgi:hypothetical protein